MDSPSYHPRTGFLHGFWTELFHTVCVQVCVFTVLLGTEDAHKRLFLVIVLALV